LDSGEQDLITLHVSGAMIGLLFFYVFKLLYFYENKSCLQVPCALFWFTMFLSISYE